MGMSTYDDLFLCVYTKDRRETGIVFPLGIPKDRHDDIKGSGT